MIWLALIITMNFVYKSEDTRIGLMPSPIAPLLNSRSVKTRQRGLKNSLLPFTMRELFGKRAKKIGQSLKDITRHLGPMIGYSIIAGLILAILAPLGTSRFPLIGRLTYWIGLCAAGGIGAGLIDILAMRFNWSLKSWVRALGQSVGSTLCVVAVLFLLFPPYNLVSAAMTIFYVWVIAIVMCCIGILIKKAQNKNVNGELVSADTRPDILERLPPKLRQAKIYAISAEDHYVRVHTSKGDHMILMRLSDAIKEAAPLTGHQTHRSWWVAEAGVESAKRKDGKIILTLKNELIAPVSRSGQKRVKDAGWV